MENTLVAPYGVAGGRAGRTGRVTLNPGTPGERELLPLGDGIALRRGDLLRLETCGGGGWGDPLEREPELVLRDVVQGKVSADAARHDYGVAIDWSDSEGEVSYALDAAATARLRAELRAARKGPLPLIDRGPGYEKMIRGEYGPRL
jgi:N-methylhydantoinase B